LGITNLSAANARSKRGAATGVAGSFGGGAKNSSPHGGEGEFAALAKEICRGKAKCPIDRQQ
jgi:hypothetical protein